MRTILKFISALGATGLAAILCIGPTAPASAAQITAGTPCTPQGALGVCMGAPPMPAQLRNLSYTPPSTGKAMVTVHGSGYCIFQDGTVEQTADFETQITDNPATVASAKAAGGLRIKIRQPKSALPPGTPITVPFSLSSTRTFPVAKNHATNFILAAHAIKFDSHVACYAFGITMTILHTP